MNTEEEKRYLRNMSLIRQNLNIKNFLGTANNSGKYCCPFCRHYELKADVKAGTFSCGCCRRSGDVLDLYMNKHNMTGDRISAANILATAFRADGKKAPAAPARQTAPKKTAARRATGTGRYAFRNTAAADVDNMNLEQLVNYINKLLDKAESMQKAQRKTGTTRKNLYKGAFS